MKNEAMTKEPVQFHLYWTVTLSMMFGSVSVLCMQVCFVTQTQTPSEPAPVGVMRVRGEDATGMPVLLKRCKIQVFLSAK